MYFILALYLPISPAQFYPRDNERPPDKFLTFGFFPYLGHSFEYVNTGLLYRNYAHVTFICMRLVP